MATRKKVYKSIPMSYRSWRQVRKEMYALAYVIAGLVAIEMLIKFATMYGVHYFGLV